MNAESSGRKLNQSKDHNERLGFGNLELWEDNDTFANYNWN